MRGAVLHKMGLNLVKERMMRRHYGVSHYRNFLEGQDPEYLRGEDAAGDIICNSVMKWYAKKVQTKQSVLNNRVKGWKMGKLWSSHSFGNIVMCNTRAPTALSWLMICTSQKAMKHPPTWNLRVITRCLLFDKIVQSRCSVESDLSSLRPFALKQGRKGSYYEVEYDLGVTFGPELEFKLVHRGRVIGRAVGSYDWVMLDWNISFNVYFVLIVIWIQFTSHCRQVMIPFWKSRKLKIWIINFIIEYVIKNCGV